MTDGYFVGIDGGGSKTHIKIVTTEGKMLAEAYSGPANIRLSVDIAIQSIADAFSKAIKLANISQNKLNNMYAGFGLAGNEIQTAREECLKKVGAFKIDKKSRTLILAKHSSEYYKQSIDLIINQL